MHRSNDKRSQSTFHWNDGNPPVFSEQRNHPHFSANSATDLFPCPSSLTPNTACRQREEPQHLLLEAPPSTCATGYCSLGRTSARRWSSMCAFKSGSRNPSLHLPLPNFEFLRCLWKWMDDVVPPWMIHQRAMSYVESTNIDHAEHEGMRRRSGPD